MNFTETIDLSLTANEDIDKGKYKWPISQILGRTIREVFFI